MPTPSPTCPDCGAHDRAVRLVACGGRCRNAWHADPVESAVAAYERWLAADVARCQAEAQTDRAAAALKRATSGLTRDQQAAYHSRAASINQARIDAGGRLER